MPRIFPQPGQKFYELTRELTELGGIHNVDFWFDRAWDNEPMLEVADTLYEKWIAEHGDPAVQDKRASTSQEGDAGDSEGSDDPQAGSGQGPEADDAAAQPGDGEREPDAQLITRPVGTTETRGTFDDPAQAGSDAENVEGAPADEVVATVDGEDNRSAANATDESTEDSGAGAKRTAKKNSTRR